jgi:hypothetical protein
MSNGHNGHQSSREIEQDVERTRAHMAETLDELRSRMSPGQILDEVLGYARDTGGGRTLSNLGRTVQDNPAPLLLIGAGVAWMMMGGNGQRIPSRRPDGSAAEGARRAAAGLSQKAGVATDAVAGMAVDLSDSLWQTAEGIGDTASSTVDAASSAMHDMRDAAYRTGDAAYRRGRDIGSNLVSTIGDQPLVLGALGLALGAALGASLPETETEDRLMGEASDAVKEQASAAAESTYEQVKAAASDTMSGEHHPEGEKTRSDETDRAASTLPSGGAA